MRKGEESRKRIIETAEKLFNRKGYANTSVQDILDALGISKGGFYHYFDTKMDLLTEVCRRRTEEWYSHGVEYVRALRAGSVEKLNAALKLMNMLDREAPAMLGLLTELGARDQDALPRNEFREITMQLLSPLVEEIIFTGISEGEFTVRRPVETARIITLLALDVNEEGARSIAQNYQNPECTLEVLEMLNAYRESIELLVNAPYGSIVLFDVADMVSAVKRVVNSMESAER
jgi:AcrR family transcriptional regulator